MRKCNKYSIDKYYMICYSMIARFFGWRSVMNITIRHLINDFLNEASEVHTGTRTNPGNLKICGSQLIHYQAPIAELKNEDIIVNLSQSSIQTGNVQKQLKASLEGMGYIAIKGVPT